MVVANVVNLKDVGNRRNRQEICAGRMEVGGVASMKIAKKAPRDPRCFVLPMGVGKDALYQIATKVHVARVVCVLVMEAARGVPSPSVPRARANQQQQGGTSVGPIVGA